MTQRDIPAPCNHWDKQIGTVEAGNIEIQSSPFCGVATCIDCVEQSRGYVQMRTGCPPSRLVTFKEYRENKAGERA